MLAISRLCEPVDTEVLSKTNRWIYAFFSASMIVLRFIAFLFMLSSFDASAASCVNSVSVITSAEYFRDEDVTATYILCPNTIFLISDRNNNGAPPVEETETSALQVRKSNIHIKCGVDGVSSNHCVFAGGSHQLVIDRPSTHGAIFNVIVQGVTFRDATVNNVLASASGTLSIKDCVFKNNDNDAVIAASPPFRNQDRTFGPSLLVRISDSLFLVRILVAVSHSETKPLCMGRTIDWKVA